MSGFFLRPVDLGALVLFFVAILVLWRLLRLHPFTQAARYLALFFVAVVALVVLWLLTATRLDAWNFYAFQTWGVLWAIAMVGLVQHVYRLGDLDPDGKEARRALFLSVLGVGITVSWATFQISQLYFQGRPTLFALPIELVNLTGYTWAFIVVVRQGLRNWRLGQTWSAASQLLPLFAGTLILFIAGVGSVVTQVQGQVPLINDFIRVFVVGIAINLIGFSYLLYRDSLNFHVVRFMSLTLLVLQTVFTFVGLAYTLQFTTEQTTVIPNATTATVYAAPTQEDLANRAQLDEWTRPIFAVEAAVCLLTIGLMMVAGTPVKTIDPYLQNNALSERQGEIIVLVAQGLNNQQIALQLMISENTVKYHLKSIYEALNLSSRTALTAWYRQSNPAELTTQ